MPIWNSSFAAGALVSALCFTAGQSAWAAPVASLTPADIVVTTTPLADPGLTALWDVNKDGINDFSFNFRQPQITGGVDWQANIFPLNNNRIIGAFDSTGDLFNPTRLTAGTSIGSASTFAGAAPVQGILGENFAGTPGGQFTLAGGYVGFSLTVGTNTYYGWLGLSVARSTGGNTPGIDFVSAAYDSTAGTAIAAGAVPEPGTWALLGLSATAMAAARLRRRAV